MRAVASISYSRLIVGEKSWLDRMPERAIPMPLLGGRATAEL